MKMNKYVEDLKAKSAAELNTELVAAKKEHCPDSDCYRTEERVSFGSFSLRKENNRGKKS